MLQTRGTPYTTLTPTLQDTSQTTLRRASPLTALALKPLNEVFKEDKFKANGVWVLYPSPLRYQALMLWM